MADDVPDALSVEWQGKKLCEKLLEPIREVRIHDEGFAAARRRSMIRIIARRTNAAAVVA